ncbi:MAG TPA: HAD family acid phosphatase [Devosiaceae bacterium]|nr:HAD family acid phosphatase [Devosiaceae bacterium]
MRAIRFGFLMSTALTAAALMAAPAWAEDASATTPAASAPATTAAPAASSSSDTSAPAAASSTAATPAASSDTAAAAAPAAGEPQNDDLDAVLWDQTSVEAKASSIGAYTLARFRLNQALLDRRWTAAEEQVGQRYRRLPPAIILDVDDTVLNTSAYQAWTVTAGTSFTDKTWDDYVKAEKDVPIAGAVDFLKYAARRGVTIFYVTNRTAGQEAPTVEEMKKFGFPMGNGRVDTFLAVGEKPDWKSAKGTRRAYIAQHYRIVLLIGDNMGDFTDKYKGSLSERDAVYEADMKHWGHDWIQIANPTYGSFQSAPFANDYSKSADEQRKEIKAVLSPWSGPTP